MARGRENVVSYTGTIPDEFEVMEMDTLSRILERKIVCIVRGLEPAYLKSLAEALLEGGIDLMEVTFVQKDPSSWKGTQEGIAAVSRHMEGKMLVGAGTVLTEEQLLMARDGGAKYIITPNTNPALIRKVKELGLISMPGAMTPSEAVAAWENGADIVKIFPAGTLGPDYIKAIRAPLSQIPLMAVGGVNEKNCAGFLAAGCCGIGVGGGLVNKEWIMNGEWDKIIALAREYRKAVG